MQYKNSISPPSSPIKYNNQDICLFHNHKTIILRERESVKSGLVGEEWPMHTGQHSIGLTQGHTVYGGNKFKGDTKKIVQ